MRKINKIMMATVSILLTLVLISSCVLSGIFAKYVTSKTASSQMQFEKFGVTVDMIVDEAKLRSVLGADCAVNLKSPTQAEKDAGKVWLETSTPDQIKAGINTVTIRNLALKPGDDLTDFVVFTIGGTANVKCKMTVDVDIAYDIENFHIPMDKAKEFGWIFDDRECYAIPLGFSYDFSAEDGTKSESYEVCPYESLACGDLIEYQLYYDRIRYTMAKNPSNAPMDPKVSFYYSDDKKECYFEKEFDVGSEVCILANDNENDYNKVAVTNMKYGIEWPEQATAKFFTDYYNITNYGNINFNEIDSYIASEKQPTIDLSYTVRVEQLDPNAT